MRFFNFLRPTPNKVLTVILLTGIVFSVIQVVKATTPNPGHDFTEIGGGIHTGGILYGSSADVLSELSFNSTATRYLANTGSGVPKWDQIDLATGVTGLLSVASVDINSSILPDTTNSVDLGSAAKTFQDAYLGGSLKLNGATSGTVTVKADSVAGTWTFTLPNGGGTNGYCLKTDGNGTATWGSCSTGVAGVSSVDNLGGDLIISNSSGVGSTITIDNAVADGTTKGIAAFNSTNFTASSGVINTIQDITTTSNPQFATIELGHASDTTLARIAAGRVSIEGVEIATSSNALTFTNKTFDTAGSGNSFKINGTTITSVTGSGAVVLATSPTLTTPNIGAATATSVNGLTISPSTGTLTISNAKTLTVNNSLTFAGTDGTTITFPGSSTTVAGLSIAETFTGAQTFQGFNLDEVSPSQLTADQNNYNPSALTNWRLSSDATRNITGFAGIATGRLIKITNVGSNNIVLNNESSSSTATNRIHTASGSDLTLLADQSIELIYDNTTQRWRDIAMHSGKITNGDLTSSSITVNGTTNQVSVSGSPVSLGGTITLSTPQDIATTSNPQFATLELGNASDTTLARIAAGRVSIEGVEIATSSNALTFTNKTFDTAGSGNSFAINGTAITAVTGTGAVVLATSPTLVTPTLGVATATSINKVAITAPATAATLTIADNKTLTVNNSLTFAGTDGTTMTFPGSSTTLAGLSIAETFTGAQTFQGFNLDEVSPSQLTADQNNYNPSALTNWRLSSDATRNITGLAGIATGRVIKITNVGSNNIVLNNESASSTATNRIHTASGGDLTLLADQSIELVYDNTTQRWRDIAMHSGKIGNGDLTASSITVNGTTNQVSVSGSPVSLGGTVTLSTPQDIATTSNPQFATLELGNASDTTLARIAAGRVSIEGVEVATSSNTLSFTNKTFNTAATGNVLQINGTTVSDVTGSGKVVLDTAPTINTITFGSHSITDSGALAIQSTTSSSVTVDSGTTGNVNVGTGANAKTVTIGNTTTTSSVVLKKGSSGGNITLNGFDCSTFANSGKLTTDSSGNIYCTDDTGGGTGGSGANTALSNLAAVAINTSLLPGTTNSIDLGATTKTFRDAYFGGTADPFYIKLTGGTATATDTLTLPDATDTLVGKATTDTFTNKTFDTAGSGNVFKINGTTISAVTGTGAVVLATSPTLVTPTLGVATATSINKVAITAPATSATLTIADGKTFTVNNSLTFAGTDGTTLTFPGSSTTVAGLSIAETFTGTQTFQGFNLDEVSPSQITADQDDYNPSALTNWRLSTDNASPNYNITGIGGIATGRLVKITNVGPAKITLNNESTSSTAGNRIHTASGSDLTLLADQSIELVYDNTTQRWRDIAMHSGKIANGDLTASSITVNGTTNQVNVSGSPVSLGGTVTLSTPQDIATTSNPQFATLELGNASDTTLARIAAGRVSIEGVEIATSSNTLTFTNKTFDTAGTGNSFAINGTAITAVTGTGAVVLANSPTLVTPSLGDASASKVTITDDDIQTTSTEGLVLQNTTAATALVPVQYSPRIRLEGTTWNPVFTSSETQDFIIENRPLEATGELTKAQFAIAWANNGGSYQDIFSYNTDLLSTFIGVSAGNGATNAANSNFIGASAGFQAMAANDSNFFGANAGGSATNARNSNFFGNTAGYQATNADGSNFLGQGAGFGATGAFGSNFLGSLAGFSATDANVSNFFGTNAGYQATNADGSNFLGFQAGYQASSAANSNFIGGGAGYQATNAASSIFLGINAGHTATNANNAIFIGPFAGDADTVDNTGNSGTSIAIGRYSGTGGFSDSIALGHGVINSAVNQANIGNVLYVNGIYGNDTQTAAEQSGAGVGIRAAGFSNFDYIKTNKDSWTTLAAAPASLSAHAMVYTGGDYIYASRGGNTTFYRYSISGNSWSTMAAAPAILDQHAMVYTGGDYIYASQGSTTTFYRYSISGNSWSTMAAAPATLVSHAMVYTGGDYIYVSRGHISTTFYRYSISGNSWSTMADAPATLTDHAMVYTGGDYIYASRGGNTTTFYRYSISGNSWSTMAAAPNVLIDHSMVYTGGDYIYASRGGSSSSLYRYSISGNSWSTMAAAPATISYAMVYTGDGYIYATQGSFSTAFYRYTVGGDTGFTALGKSGALLNDRLYLQSYANDLTGSATARTLALQQDSNTYTFQTSAQTGDVYNWFVGQPTIATPSSSTITNAANVYIANAPAAGTNTTITNAYALWVDNGTTRLDSSTVTTGKILDIATTADTWTGNGTTSGLVNLASTSTAGTASSSDILFNVSRSGANANADHTAYGIYSSVTNTNATSGTNVAAFLNASNASGSINRYALLTDGGKIGVNTYSAINVPTLVFLNGGNGDNTNGGYGGPHVEPFNNVLTVAADNSLLRPDQVGGGGANAITTAVEHSAGSSYSGALSVLSSGDSSADTVGGIHVAVPETTPTSRLNIGINLLANGGSRWDNITALADGNFLPAIAFSGQTDGNQGTGMTIGASIQAIVDGTVATNVLPTDLIFNTSATDSAGLGERVRITSTGKVGIGDSTPAALLTVGNGDLFQVNSSGTLTINKDGIATTSTDAIALQNSTAATALVPVQYSPRIRLKGTAWDGTVSQTQDWILENRPINLGGGFTSSQFAIAASDNGGSYSDIFLYDRKLQSSFIGLDAGSSATNSHDSNFLGFSAGNGATDAFESNFFGQEAGYLATNANDSNFFGLSAGENATNANDSNFLGANAGNGATGAENSNFFGNQAGFQATAADHSNFLGYQAGYQATNANESNFFGENAGFQATDASFSNFLGINAGSAATSANLANFLGFNAGANATNASESNFLGSNAGVSATFANNSNFLGYQTGLNATNANNSNFFGSDTGNGATNADNSNFFGQSAGNGATAASGSNFFGNFAGLSATNANDSNFFGGSAGSGATAAALSNFFGPNAGNSATNADHSNFFGLNAGNGATNAAGSNFFGQNAGNAASSAFSSNFFGPSAGHDAANANLSNFIGNSAGGLATNAYESNFLGDSAGDNATNANGSNFIGSAAGQNATNADQSNFIGIQAGIGAANAKDSIFIGTGAGFNDTVDNTSNGLTSILIGRNTSTGGYSGSIALGHDVVNSTGVQADIGNVLFINGIYYGGGTDTPSSAPQVGSHVGIGINDPGQALTVSGTTITSYPKEGYLSTDNVLLSSLDGGMYFGGVGVKEQQLGLNNYGTTWTPKDTTRFWYDVAMNSDGSIQTAVVSGGQIYISTDYGNTWTAKDSSRSWSSIAMNSDGKVQTATVNVGQIYISTDYGNTWTAKDSARNWISNAMSSDGKYQTAVEDGGGGGGAIYNSTDYGNTWIGHGELTPVAWSGIAMSSDGKIQTAVANGDQIYGSTDYGNTWNVLQGPRDWFGVAMSSDGKYQTAVDNLGFIFVSANYGTTWAAKTGPAVPYGIAMSSNGKIQTAIGNPDQIYVSTDYGNTWNAEDSTRDWLSIAMSSDGKIQTALESSGYIYVSSADSYNPYGKFGLGTNSPGGVLSVAGANTTGTTTASDLNLTSSSLTTGSLAYLNSSSITSGKLLDVATSGNTWTGNGTSSGLVNIQSSSTAGAVTNSDILLNIARSGVNAAASHTAYGIYSSVTNSGSSSTNVAGYFSALNGTNNYGLIVDGGNVGIGTTTPTANLGVVATNVGGASTSSAISFTDPSLTYGTLQYLNSSSITAGRLLDVDGNTNTWTGNGTSSGLVNLASNSTGGTASGSDILLNISRSGANANTAHTAYGIYSSVTNTNATSGTNVGGYFTASGATTANYSLQAVGLANFDYIKTNKDSWTSLAAAPAALNASVGHHLTYTGGNFIYASNPTTTALYRYSISGDSWATMTTAPLSLDAGSSLAYTGGDFIYALRGGSTTTFYRYSISGNSWLTMTAAPAAIDAGASLSYAGGDYIYALRGNTLTDFYRYSISGDSWSVMTAAPATIAGGSDLAYTGGDYIYATRGNATTTFYRYSISDNSWTSMTAAPGTINGGGTLAYSGGDYIYALRGGSVTDFYRYSISSNSWSTMTSTPASISSGGSSIFTGDYIYAVRGNGSATFYRYSPGGDTGFTALGKKGALLNDRLYLQSYPNDLDGSATARALMVRQDAGTYTFNTSAQTGDVYNWFIGQPTIATPSASAITNAANLYIANSPANGTNTTITNAYSLWVAGGATRFDGDVQVGAGLDVTEVSPAQITADQNNYNPSALTNWRLSSDATRNITGIAGTANGRIIKITNVGSFSIVLNNENAGSTAANRIHTASGSDITLSTDQSIVLIYDNTTQRWRDFTAKSGAAAAAGAGGSNTQIQYNSGGSLAGVSSFTTDGSTLTLSNSTVTTGKLFDIATSGNSWTGNGTTSGLVNIASTSTGGTAASSDILLNISRSGANANTGHTSYGIYSSVTDTNATSGTNVGGYFTASGATTANYSIQAVGLANFDYLKINRDNWTTLAAAPDTIAFTGQHMAYTGGDYIYALRGNATAAFYRYSISNNSWSTMTPFAASGLDGGSLAYTGGDFIYATQGGLSPVFWRYSISADSWSAMTSAPSGITTGGSLAYTGGNYIYATHGGDTAFYRYSISGNSWSTMTAAPGNIIGGGSLAYSHGDYIYALAGNGTATFYRYSISTNSWTTMSAAPGSVSNGGSLAYAGGDYIYALRGNTQTSVYRYSISTDSWSTMTAAPATIDAGGSLVYAGGDYMYALRGGTTTTFYRYTVGGDTGFTDTRTLGNIQAGVEGNTTGGIAFYSSGDATKTTILKAADTPTANVTWTLPTSDNSGNGGCLTSNGSGTMTVLTCSGTSFNQYADGTSHQITVPKGTLLVIVESWGAGGGGGGGASAQIGGNSTQARGGGAGGGGGAYNTATFTFGELGGTANNLFVIAGQGGTSGTGGKNSAVGADGSAGNNSYLCAKNVSGSPNSTCSGTGETSFLIAYGGGGGSGGRTTTGAAGGGGGGGGGTAGAGTSVAGSSTGGAGGANAGGAAGNPGGNSAYGGGGGATAGNTGNMTGGTSVYAGGGGGGASTNGNGTSSATSGAGGNAWKGGAGGGGGGTANTANINNNVTSGTGGGSGGNTQYSSASFTGNNGSGATNGAGASLGGTAQNNGNAGTSYTFPGSGILTISSSYGGGGGGGGAFRGNTAANNINAGIGGNGGTPAGGGGGGGAMISNNSTSPGVGGGNGGAGGNGEINVSVIQGTAADLAEIYSATDDSLEPGDVVAIDPSMQAAVKKSAKPYDSNLIGVISTIPSMVMGSNENPGTKSVALALAGRTPVKVSTENGKILPGDYLTSSSIPGVAMKLTKFGPAIGQAMFGYDGDAAKQMINGQKVGLIIMFIKNGFVNGADLSQLINQPVSPLVDTSTQDQQNQPPPTDTTDSSAEAATVSAILSGQESPPLTGSPPAQPLDLGRKLLLYLSTQQDGVQKENLSEIFTDRVAAAVEIIAPRVVTNNLVVNAIEPVDKNIQINLADGGKMLVHFGDPATEPLVSIDQLGNALFTGALTAANLEVGSADKPGGITFYDTKNQKPYCLVMTDGSLKTLEGKCEEALLKLKDDAATDQPPATSDTTSTDSLAPPTSSTDTTSQAPPADTAPDTSSTSSSDTQTPPAAPTDSSTAPDATDTSPPPAPPPESPSDASTSPPDTTPNTTTDTAASDASPPPDTSTDVSPPPTDSQTASP